MQSEIIPKCVCVTQKMPWCVIQHMKSSIIHGTFTGEVANQKCLSTVVPQPSNLTPIGQQPAANNQQIKYTVYTHFRFIGQNFRKHI